ncbi:MAG: hypothetical protein GWP05_00880 [Anaerolineaceae bacterium]|nr:hypothetical protein [Anaerolineaceae bacterium]
MQEKTQTSVQDRNGRARAPAWRHLGGAALVGPLLLAFLVYTGCSEATRYRTLSFFFDGVPPPEGMEPRTPEKVVGPWGVPVDPNAPNLPPRFSEGRPEKEAQPEAVYYHEPYKKRRCVSCHTPERSYAMVTPIPGLCMKCHSDVFPREASDWVHGPAAAGGCQLCHRGHEAPNRNLLPKPEPDLCWTCHQASRVLSRPYHVDTGRQKCSACHDPHVAGNRLLLADSRTYRRRGTRGSARSVHSAWSRDDCTKCHIPERSNMVIENVDEVCVTCHDDQLRPVAGRQVHAPVRQGQCTLCHTPHKSILPNLIKPAAEEICYTCHSADEIRVSTHPRVERADCLLCHQGHTAKGAYLLRPGIPLVRRAPRAGPSASGVGDSTEQMGP